MNRYFGVAFGLLIGFSTVGSAQPFAEVIDFESLPPRCVATSTEGDFGTGPIGIRGVSKRFGERINAAVVVDTAHPDADADLATRSYHNALIVSRVRPMKPSGPDAAWVAGSVKTLDDDDIPGAVLRFDFEEVGPITFYGLTLLDHDDHPASVRIFRTPGASEIVDSVAPGTRLELTWGPHRWPNLNWFSRDKRRARLTLPSDEQPYYRLQIAPLPSGKPAKIDAGDLRARGHEARSAIGRARFLADGIPDVSKVEVELGGSSAVDNVVFRRQGAGTPSIDEGLFAKIQSYLTREIEPKLEVMRKEFSASVEELVTHPTSPTLRPDLDRLIVELERKLIGAFDEDGIRVGGLLQCPDLECGCPQLRALQAWVETKVATMRAHLAESAELEPAAVLAARGEVLLAGVEPARYVAAALADGRVALAQTGGQVDCAGTFWEQFFCEGRVLLAGVSSTVANLIPTRVRFEPASITVAEAPVRCEAFRLAPKSREFSHVETGILPGTERRIPRGLYCVFCKTSDRTLPWATLDLVEDSDARPRPVGDEAESCAIRG